MYQAALATRYIFHSMTDLECKKICRVLDVKDIWIDNDGVCCVKFNNGSCGHVYIYIESFSNALPFRTMKSHSVYENVKKTMIERLLKQSNEGIKSAVVLNADNHAHKIKLMGNHEALESFLMRYDILFTKRRTSKTVK